MQSWSSDAKYAWQKLDGYFMDGRRWKVEYATRKDFDDFDWKWTEYTPERSFSPRGRNRSRTRSPPRSGAPDTPYGRDSRP